MSIFSSADFYQRNLPHIAARCKPLFVTFGTFRRRHLPPGARTIALKHAVFGHPDRYFMHVAVVMPDHVHLVLTLPSSLDDGTRSQR